MKYLITFIVLGLLSSCSIVKVKTMNTVQMQFAPLPATPSGDYQSEATLIFRRNMVKDKEILKNFKQGNFTNAIEPIYVNTNQNTLFGKVRVFLFNIWGSERSRLKLASDPTYNLALYNLAEQYPNVDYWTNIRIERTVQGRNRFITKLFNKFRVNKKSPYIKTGPETVKIKATGINIMTDEEYELFKNTDSYNELDYQFQ